MIELTSYETFEGRYFDGQSSVEHKVTGRFSSRDLSFNADSLEHEVIWQYQDLRELRDQVTGKGITVHVTGEPGRLTIADSHSASVVQRRAQHLGKRDHDMRAYKRVGMWAGGAVASVLLILFVIIPALANQLADLLPVEREVALGKSSLNQIERIFARSGDGDLACTDEKGTAALEKMTARLTAHFDNPYPLNIQVFDHEMVNAFAVPGGHVVLFDGLLQAADTPEEVAGVLGHELGHVINKDPTRLTLRSAGSVGILGMVFGDFAGGAAALIIAERLMAASYQQDAESNADLFAHEVLAKASLPAAPFGDFFEKLKDEHGEVKGLISHLASHPDLGERAEEARRADSIGAESFVPVLTDEEWADLKNICGI